MMNACSLCGTNINTQIVGRDWVITVRALHPSSDGYRISSAGKFEYNYMKCSLKLPSEENDDKLKFSTNDIFTHQGDPKKIFIIHDACWKILKAYFHDAPVPLDRMADVFRLGSEEMSKELHIDPLKQKMKDPSEPYNLKKSKRRMKAIPDPSSTLTQQRKKQSNGDIFKGLPLEIREMIAVQLSMEDFYGLRFASRVMGDIFFNRVFWGARFDVDGERGYMALPKTVLTEKGLHQGDLRLMYKLTRLGSRSSTRFTRKMFWERCRWFRDMITRTTPSSTLNASRKDLKISNWIWKEVEVPRLLKMRVALKQIVCVPSSLKLIFVSLIRGMHTTYITGIELVSDRDPLIRLGYMIPGTRVMCQVKSFKGFVVALGDTGIHAIKIISNDAQDSSWIREFNGVCVTSRPTQDEANALEFRFDRYKLVSLAVATKPSPAKRTQQLQSIIATWTDMIMQNALWLPNKPPDGLHFSDSSTYGADPLAQGYRPFVWHLFGDEDGSRLSSLTQISIGISRNRMYKLYFHYNGEGKASSRLDWQAGEDFDRKRFAIDGPGGEKITSVQVAAKKRVDWTTTMHINGPVPLYYKITTNFGRYVWTRRQDECEPAKEGFSLQNVDIAAGTMPVGFYAIKQNELGIVSLGVISVALEDGS